ncbi:MAG: hypothetical protein J0L97_00740 [Alphaproteobacteria bacterium]|nr:hypothetical protein [Alphaproteobacteria bacterium]
MLCLRTVCLLAALAVLAACAQKTGQEPTYSATGKVYDNNTMMHYYYIK